MDIKRSLIKKNTSTSTLNIRFGTSKTSLTKIKVLSGALNQDVNTWLKRRSPQINK